jgi:nucleotide-binding universal stress UspA family protein
MNVKPIVVGTDGSEESLRAVEWAAGEAILHAVSLRIVSAALLAPAMTALQIRSDRDHVADFIRSERDLALDAAASRAARVAPGLVIVTDPVAGLPAQGVTASGSGAAMLVVGCRGAGAFTALTLGSVSRHAAAHAACPVVVVRDLLPAASGLIGVGVGDLDDCADPLTFAFDEASLRKAAVLAIHAWPGPVPEAPESPAAAAAGARLAELMESWASKYPGVPVSQQVVPGHPAQALIGLSARADLVVIGRHGAHPGPHGPGPTRHAVLSHAHGPVAVIPSGR